MHGGKRVSSLQRQAKFCTYFKPCFSDSLHLMFCVYMSNVVENPIHLPVLCLTPAGMRWAVCSWQDRWQTYRCTKPQWKTFPRLSVKALLLNLFSISGANKNKLSKNEKKQKPSAKVVQCCVIIYKNGMWKESNKWNRLKTVIDGNR